MGFWGNGILESDIASEYLGEVIERIEKDIDCDIASLNNGILERITPTAIAILNALATLAPVNVLVTVNSEKVAAWHVIFQQWLIEIENSESQDAAEWAAYRDVVDREFSQLIEKLDAAD